MKNIDIRVLLSSINKNNLKKKIIGDPRDPLDQTIFKRLSLIAIFAWVGLGSDALSSASYGPEEAFRALGQHIYLAIFVSLGIMITIFIISTSYSQIVELFPSGGGGYLVASKLLSPSFGMISGCALLIDYVLTISISIASGVDAIFSFLPLNYQEFKIIFALFVISILIILNLRGVKESVLSLIPIFVLFMLTHIFAILYTIITHISITPTIINNTTTDIHKVTFELGFVGLLFLILHAYSMGAGTYTGIEAVSNAMPILREPKIQTAKRTMRYMAFSLSFMVIGLMLGYIFIHVAPEQGKTLNAVLFENVYSKIPFGNYLILITLISEAMLLFVAAQTGFLDGPRVLANMALDRWMPTKFAALSDRFVSQNGVLIMGAYSTVMILLTGGSVDFLVVLYSIAVFITFILSQAGMVRHWWNSKLKIKDWKHKLIVNGVGLAMTIFILISVIIVKFNEGGWITIFILGLFVGGVLLIRKHYEYAAKLIKKLDSDVDKSKCVQTISKNSNQKIDLNEKTAILLVNGYNGLGFSAITNIFKLFGTIYKNFIFVQIGVIDAGVFKGVEEIKFLQQKTQEDLDNYVNLIKNKGYYSESFTSIGTDVVEEITKLAPTILKRFPNAVFFGGQIVFPNGSILARWLHNYTVFASQKQLYSIGIPFIILPIKIS